MAELKSAVAIKVGGINTIPEGQGRCFVVEDKAIAVFRQRDGQLFATENRCPHRNGSLADGLVGNGHVICPLHGHRFDLETGEGGEPGECVRVLETQIVDGEIVLTDA